MKSNYSVWMFLHFISIHSYQSPSFFNSIGNVLMKTRYKSIQAHRLGRMYTFKIPVKKKTPGKNFKVGRKRALRVHSTLHGFLLSLFLCSLSPFLHVCVFCRIKFCSKRKFFSHIKWARVNYVSVRFVNPSIESIICCYADQPLIYPFVWMNMSRFDSFKINRFRAVIYIRVSRFRTIWNMYKI